MMKYRPRPDVIGKCPAARDHFYSDKRAYLIIQIVGAITSERMQYIEYKTFSNGEVVDRCNCYRKEDLVPFRSGIAKINLGNGTSI